MHVANVQWRTFIVYAVLIAAFIPVVYFFSSETKGIELEDIPLLFAKGGITGGVASSKGGRTVVQSSINEKIEVDHQRMERVET